MKVPGEVNLGPRFWASPRLDPNSPFYSHRLHWQSANTFIPMDRVKVIFQNRLRGVGTVMERRPDMVESQERILLDGGATVYAERSHLVKI